MVVAPPFGEPAVYRVAETDLDLDVGYHHYVVALVAALVVARQPVRRSQIIQLESCVLLLGLVQHQEHSPKTARREEVGAAVAGYDHGDGHDDGGAGAVLSLLQAL